MKVRILSSNVWGNCPDDQFIADRNQKLSEVYLSLLPDFIGLQERSLRSRTEAPDFSELIGGEYTEIPVEPTNELKNNFTPGYYRRSAWELLESGWHYFSGRNDKGSKSITWGAFQSRKGEGRVLFFNMHYYWRPDAEGHATRLQNTKELLALYREVSAKYPYPAFFTGDFNSATADEPIQNLLAGGLKEAWQESEAPVERLRSYHYCPEADRDAEGAWHYVRGFLPDDRLEWSIDHIFFDKARILSYVTVTDPRALEGSDHCPIYVDAEI